MAFMAIIMGLGLFFDILLGFRECLGLRALGLYYFGLKAYAFPKGLGLNAWEYRPSL